MWNENFDDKDFKLKLQYRVKREHCSEEDAGEKSEKIDFDSKDSTRSPKHNLHCFDI